MPEYGEALTDRERDILHMVATGVTNREVAYRLDISVNTVKVHLRNIFTKLGAESRTEATMIAVREGWVSMDTAETASQDEGPATPPAPVVAPGPPLPWPGRIALAASLLVVTAGVGLTWPRGDLEAEAGLDLPLDRSQGVPASVPVGQPGELWSERAQMPTRRAHLALAASGGRVFAIAGQGPRGVTAAVEVYDPAQDSWTQGSDKPTPVAYISAAAIGSTLIVPGGCDAEGVALQVTEVYDVSADAWREASPMPEPRCAYALAVWGEKLYLFGGWDGAQYAATAYTYDLRSDRWAEIAPLDTPRGFAASAPLGDRLYVVGGYDGERELAACDVYDPVAEAWETCAPLMVGRGGLGLVATGGCLYAIGGGGWTSYLGFGERYGPADSAWSPVQTPLIGEWRNPGVVVIETSIYAVGGWSGDYLSLNQVYEPLPFQIFIPVSQQ